MSYEMRFGKRALHILSLSHVSVTIYKVNTNAIEFSNTVPKYYCIDQQTAYIYVQV